MMSGLNICKVPLFVYEDGQYILNYFTNILLTDLPRRVNDSFRTKSTNAMCYYILLLCKCSDLTAIRKDPPPTVNTHPSYINGQLRAAAGIGNKGLHVVNLFLKN